MMTSWSQTTSDYDRRLIIKDGFLAVQLVVNGIPAKEFGFDFKNKVYYESDLLNKDYRQYLFSKINEDYANRKTALLRSSARLDTAAGMLGNQARRGNEVKKSKSLIRRKKIGSFDCVLYRYTIGPGYSPFAPLSWGKDIKAWVTNDIPGYGQYEDTIDALKRECMFYTDKSNEISDFIITLLHSDGFPAEIHETIRRDFGVGKSVTTSSAMFSKLDTRLMPESEISYFRDKNEFIVNPIEERSPVAYDSAPFPLFGRAGQGKQARAVNFNYKREEDMLARFYIIFIPVVVYGGLAYYVFRHITRRTPMAVTGGPGFDFYRMFVALYILQIAHIFAPYYIISEGIEFSLLIAAGSILIVVVRHLSRTRRRKEVMASGHSKTCPHCRSVIDRIYAVCPVCNKNVNEK